MLRLVNSLKHFSWKGVCFFFNRKSMIKFYCKQIFERKGCSYKCTKYIETKWFALNLSHVRPVSFWFFIFLSTKTPVWVSRNEFLSYELTLQGYFLSDMTQITPSSCTAYPHWVELIDISPKAPSLYFYFALLLTLFGFSLVTALDRMKIKCISRKTHKWKWSLRSGRLGHEIS